MPSALDACFVPPHCKSASGWSVRVAPLGSPCLVVVEEVGGLVGFSSIVVSMVCPFTFFFFVRMVKRRRWRPQSPRGQPRVRRGVRRSGVEAWDVPL